jgi:hypothetical protein
MEHFILFNWLTKSMSLKHNILYTDTDIYVNKLTSGIIVAKLFKD